MVLHPWILLFTILTSFRRPTLVLPSLAPSFPLVLNSTPPHKSCLLTSDLIIYPIRRGSYPWKICKLRSFRLKFRYSASPPTGKTTPIKIGGLPFGGTSRNFSPLHGRQLSTVKAIYSSLTPTDALSVLVSDKRKLQIRKYQFGISRQNAARLNICRILSSSTASTWFKSVR